MGVEVIEPSLVSRTFRVPDTAAAKNTRLNIKNEIVKFMFKVTTYASPVRAHIIICRRGGVAKLITNDEVKGQSTLGVIA